MHIVGGLSNDDCDKRSVDSVEDDVWTGWNDGAME